MHEGQSIGSRTGGRRRVTLRRLVLLRHGQSAWNLENRFTGWTDVDLTPLGEAVPVTHHGLWTRSRTCAGRSS